MEANNNEVIRTNENAQEAGNVTEQNNNSTNNSQTTQTNTNKSINVCCLLSFIFSIIGIFIFGLPCGIAATILGIIGIATFKEDKQKSKWFGITGLTIGVIEVVIMGIFMAVIS